MLEPVVSWLEEFRAIDRITAVITAALTAWLLVLASVYSFNLLADFHPLGFIRALADKTFFDIVDFTVDDREGTVRTLGPVNGWFGTFGHVDPNVWTPAAAGYPFQVGPFLTLEILKPAPEGMVRPVELEYDTYPAWF